MAVLQNNVTGLSRAEKAFVGLMILVVAREGTLCKRHLLIFQPIPSLFYCDTWLQLMPQKCSPMSKQPVVPETAGIQNVSLADLTVGRKGEVTLMTTIVRFLEVLPLSTNNCRKQLSDLC